MGSSNENKWHKVLTYLKLFLQFAVPAWTDGQVFSDEKIKKGCRSYQG